jgi:hypothetical protein
VQVGEQRLALAHPGVFGLDRLLDLQQQVGLGPHLVRALDDLRARGRESSSWIADPSPAPAWTTTSWPRRTSSDTPAGVMATRYSLFLISVGIP